MFNSAVLDVAIGLIFVYLALSLMCTTANEWIAQMFSMRANTLKQGIDALLHHEPLSPASFSGAEINPMKLLARLTSPGDKLAAALGLDPADRPRNITLDSAELPAVRDALAGRLNSLLSDATLYQKIDVRGVSDDVLKAVKKAGLSGDGLQKANAALLRAAYPEELGSLAVAFFNHPLIQSLAQSGKIPSYVSATAFSGALSDILGRREGIEAVRQTIASLPEGRAKQALLTLSPPDGATLADFEHELQRWFDQSMDRVSGWYKRKTQIITVVVAAGITIWANADTVGIARKLFLNPALREKIAQEKPSDTSTLTPDQKAALGNLTGWGDDFVAFHRLKSGAQSSPDESFPGVDLLTSPQTPAWIWMIVPGHILGWVLTAMAVSLGAPFWFDTLNKFMNIRSAGTAPNEKATDKSKA